MPLVRKDPPVTTSLPSNDLNADVARLEQGSVEERWLAARRLGEVQSAVSVLRNALATEAENRVREAILTSLVNLNSPASVEAVIPELHSDDSSRRNGALDALKAMPRATASHVSALLGDPDPDVRILACELARDVPSAGGIAALADVLERDAVINVCAAAIDALAEIGTAAERPALERCLARFPKDPFIAFAVKTAMARLGGALE